MSKDLNEKKEPVNVESNYVSLCPGRKIDFLGWTTSSMPPGIKIFTTFPSFKSLYSNGSC